MATTKPVVLTHTQATIPLKIARNPKKWLRAQGGRPFRLWAFGN